jgi:FkbM family methyltransferase
MMPKPRSRLSDIPQPVIQRGNNGDPCILVNSPKEFAKRKLRLLLMPLVRMAVRYTAPGRLRSQLWRRITARFFQSVDYPFVGRTQSGALVAGNTRDLIQRFIYFFGVWEPNLTRFLERRLKSGDVFVDIGANIGYFTLQASRLVGDTGKVIAFEASPKVYAYLLENLRRNVADNVDARNLAVSDRKGMVKVFLGHDTNIGETSTLAVDGFAYECEIQTESLGTLVAADLLKKVRIIKVDVEGAEWDVVQGMLGLLAAADERVEIVIEIIPRRLRTMNRDSQDIVDIFSEFGFYPYRLEHDYNPQSYVTGASSRPIRIRAPIETKTDVVFSKIDADLL